MEQRKSPRIQTDALVDVAGKDVLLFHRIRDISMGGLCIDSPTPEEVGTEVDLVVNFPDLDEVIETRGVVVWSHDEPRKGMAIKFLDLTEEQRSILRRYLGLRYPDRQEEGSDAR